MTAAVHWSVTHGHTRGHAMTPEYTAWMSMRRRCEDPRGPMFRHYGGRGISVCRRWRKSFEAFLADVGPRPSPLHSLDRIDNDRNYEPGNVRWATRIEQASNKRTSRLIEYRGRTQTAAAWARELGILYNTVLERLKRGWPAARSLSEPIDVRRRRKS
jgi:hypothetical protein